MFVGGAGGSGRGKENYKYEKRRLYVFSLLKKNWIKFGGNFDRQVTPILGFKKNNFVLLGENRCPVEGGNKCFKNGTRGDSEGEKKSSWEFPFFILLKKFFLKCNLIKYFSFRFN